MPVLTHNELDEKIGLDYEKWAPTDDSKVFIYKGKEDKDCHKLKVNLSH